MLAGGVGVFSPNSATTVNGTLNLANFANGINSLSGSGSVITGGTSGILTVANGGSFSGGITGAGGLSVSGGTLALSASTSANTYSGPTTIATCATLESTATNAFSPNSALTAHGTVDLFGYSVTIPSLFGSGFVESSSGTPTLIITNGGSFSGSIFTNLSLTLDDRGDADFIRLEFKQLHGSNHDRFRNHVASGGFGCFFS